MGNPTQRAEDSGVSTYTFNNLNQLVTGNWSGTLSAFGWTRAAGLSGVSVTAGQQTETATVFQNGDWTAKGLTVPAGDTTLSVVRTAQDQTTATAEATVTRPADATQFTHDLNGNMLALDGWTLAWDDENRLVSAVKTGSAKVECVYDGLGRRRVRRLFAWDPQAETWTLTSEIRFVWDGWNLLAELSPQVSSLSPQRVYTLGLDLSGQLGGEGQDTMATAGGIGGILAVTSSSPSTPDPRHAALFLYDGNGNVVALASADSATVLATYEYGPFGNTLVASGPLADTNPIRFSTKYFEGAQPPGSELQVSGFIPQLSAFIPQPSLYYYGFRYYSPGLGRWVSRDPLAEARRLQERLTALRCPRQRADVQHSAIAPAHLFVANQPTKATDPHGELAYCEPGVNPRLLASLCRLVLI
jgi:RHS repeat-associated protein